MFDNEVKEAHSEYVKIQEMDGKRDAGLHKGGPACPRGGPACPRGILPE